MILLRIKPLIALLFLLNSQVLYSKLLDKITAVIDDEVITQSQVQRVLSNKKARAIISPQIYQNPDKLNQKNIIDILINKVLVRSKLNEMGYVVGDDQVEAQIKSTEKRLGLTRAIFANFLKENNLSYDEYFEIIRETLEYNLFIGRVIQPLVSISEQEVKTAFYEKNKNGQTITFKYVLVNFVIDKKHVKNISSYHKALKNYHLTGSLPNKYASLTADNLQDISEEDLVSAVKKSLAKTSEGDISRPVLLGDYYHAYLVKNKNIVQSQLFQRSQEQIYRELFEKRAHDVKLVWLEKEKAQHYFKLL